MTPNRARPWHTMDKLPELMTMPAKIEVCNIANGAHLIVLYGGGPMRAQFVLTYSHWKQAEPMPNELLPEQPDG